MTNQNDLLRRLEIFGLSEHEAKVYMYLLKRGVEVGGSKIAIGTGLHRQYVYLAIKKLLEEGIIVQTPYGKHSKYKALPPGELEKISRKRTVFASELSRDLNFISNIGNDQDFEIFQGQRAIQQYEMDYVERSQPDWEEYIIGGASQKFVDLMGDYLEEYLTMKGKKGLKMKYIGNKNEVLSYLSFAQGYKNLEHRYLDNMPTGVSHMVVRKETVSFYSFLNPPLLYIVKSPVMADYYKQFFMMLWNLARQ